MGLNARSRRGRNRGGLGHWSWVTVQLLPWEQEVRVIEDTDQNNIQAKIIYLIFLWECVGLCVCVHMTAVDYCSMLFALSNQIIQTCVIWAFFTMTVENTVLHTEKVSLVFIVYHLFSVFSALPWVKGLTRTQTSCIRDTLFVLNSIWPNLLGMTVYFI